MHRNGHLSFDSAIRHIGGLRPTIDPSPILLRSVRGNPLHEADMVADQRRGIRSVAPAVPNGLTDPTFLWVGAPIGMPHNVRPHFQHLEDLFSQGVNQFSTQSSAND